MKIKDPDLLVYESGEGVAMLGAAHWTENFNTGAHHEIGDKAPFPESWSPAWGFRLS